MKFSAQIRTLDISSGEWIGSEGVEFDVKPETQLTDLEIFELGMLNLGLDVNDYDEPFEAVGPDGSTYYFTQVSKDTTTRRLFYLFEEWEEEVES
jgi:hypothetical protein